MRDGSSLLLPSLSQPTKEVGLRATFRRTLPSFSLTVLTDSLGLTDAAFIDACNWGSGILRVTSSGNVLYTQNITDIHAAWPAWSSTGISLFTGSRPAVDEGYVWYQKADGNVAYRLFSAWGTEVVVKSMSGATHLAPIQDRCFAVWQRSAGSYEIVSVNNQESSQYAIFGPTTLPRLDAVSFNGKEYIYSTDRTAGRMIEIQHSGNAVSGKDSYGVLKPIIPIDAIDDVYSFKPGYASVIDSRVVVTGQLVRSSDDTSVQMDIYSIGPEYFSLGREMFIKEGTALRAKMLRVDNEFVVAGATQLYIAKATNVFGGTTHPDLETQTSDFSVITLTEAETRTTNLNIDMDPEVSHAAIDAGSDVELEVGFDDEWCSLTTAHVEADRTNTNEEGQSRIVSGVGKTAKRLAGWSPEQGVWVPSQAKMYDNPASLTQVIRATGQWESADPEDEDAPIKLNDLNKLGVLYSSARPSRGGAMRGKFYFPSDTHFKPYYGVAINYYRESAAEAAERLGVDINDLEDDMFGHNGIVAIYSATEHSGGPGISLNLWKDSVLTKLTSVSITIPAATWHWLQIEFIEGEIRVKYRTDASVSWADYITFMYNQSTSPWKRDTLGRGAIVMKNIMPTAAGYPLGSSDDVVCVDSLSSFPTSGTLLIDNEQIAYTAVSGNTPPAGYVLMDFPAASRVTPGQPWQSSLCATHDAFLNTTSVNAYTNYGAVVVGELAARSIKILKSMPGNAGWIQSWVPTAGYIGGWHRTINDTSAGGWTDVSAAGLYLTNDPTKFVNVGSEPLEQLATDIKVYIRPAFRNLTRGANGTSAVMHTGNPGEVVVTLYTALSVQCAIAASFSQDEDQTIEDALKVIVGMAGGSASAKAVIDEEHVFAAAGVVTQTLDHKNFICELDLPAFSVGTSVGVSFRATGAITFPSSVPVSSDGYYLSVSRVTTNYYLTLSKMSAFGITNVEQVPIRPVNTNGAATNNVPVGTLRLSVQDNLFSVWLNGRYIYTFYHTEYSGLNMAFVSSLAATFHIHLSELDDILSDIVVGTRGNGMSVLAELLADRHILWRDEPDGSMYFYKTRDQVDDVPDIISSVSENKSDTVISRMRIEGLKVSEIMDADLIKQYGNTYIVANARHANTVGEARLEGELLIDENWRNSRGKQYAMDVHPGLQPGDAANFTDLPDNGQSLMIVVGQSITIGFAGNGFVCDMQCDVIPLERE